MIFLFSDPYKRCSLSSVVINYMFRFIASDLLERSRNGRIVFAGDSIARNQWESFLCMLSQGVSNKSTIYEPHGKL